MVNPAALVDERDHILLDFNGPVCDVFGAVGGRAIADRLKGLLGSGLPEAVDTTDDPFEVLNFAVACGSSTATVVEQQLRRFEAEAVVSAPVTPGAFAVIRALRARGHTVTIVSNNSADAVRAFLTMHDLAGHALWISARTSSETPLKPDPQLLEQAMKAHGASPENTVMIGDSISDITAAKSANVSVVSFADKDSRRAAFERHLPDAIVYRMTQLVGPPT